MTSDDGNDSPSQADGSELIVRSQDGRLQAEFVWQADRYAHRLLLDGVPLATSIEGDASDPWPPSPPLQQLSLEVIRSGSDAPAQPIVLGVGAAGRGHWSVSAGNDPDRPDALLFDLACRRNEPAAFLGSSYAFSPAPGERTLLIEPLEQSELQPDNDVADAVRIVAAKTAQPTVRWRYRVTPVR